MSSLTATVLPLCVMSGALPFGALRGFAGRTTWGMSAMRAQAWMLTPKGLLPATRAQDRLLTPKYSRRGGCCVPLSRGWYPSTGSTRPHLLVEHMRGGENARRYEAGHARPALGTVTDLCPATSGAPLSSARAPSSPAHRDSWHAPPPRVQQRTGWQVAIKPLLGVPDVAAQGRSVWSGLPPVPSIKPGPTPWAQRSRPRSFATHSSATINCHRHVHERAAGKGPGAAKGNERTEVWVVESAGWVAWKIARGASETAAPAVQHRQPTHLRRQRRGGRLVCIRPSHSSINPFWCSHAPARLLLGRHRRESKATGSGLTSLEPPESPVHSR